MPESPIADPILGLRFLPDWLKEDAPAKSIYADFDDDSGSSRSRDSFREGRGGNRPQRGGGGGDGRSDSPDRRNRNAGAQGRQGAKPGMGNRPNAPRLAGGGSGPGRNDQRGGTGQRRNDARPDRDRNQRGPRTGDQGESRENRVSEVEPAPMDVTFHPPQGIAETILRQIKGTFLAYPLFRIAKLFLEQPDRHLLRIKMREGKMYQSRTGGPIALSPSAIARSLFDACWADFYDVVVEEGEEIKGNFTSVARCGLSGEILGPTNHHAYQNTMRAIYSQRYANRMSFDAYRARVTVVSDPDLVARWKNETRRRERFVFKGIPEAKSSTAAIEAENPIAAPEGEVPALSTESNIDEPVAPSITDETPPEVGLENSAPASEMVSEPVTDEGTTTDEPVVNEASAETETQPEAIEPVESTTAEESDSGENADASESSESGESEASDVVAGPTFDPNAPSFASREDAYHHFEGEVLPSLITEITSAELYGRDARMIDDPSIREALHLAWEGEMRFPQNISKDIAAIASKVGVHIFKHEKRFLHLAGIRPTPISNDLNRLSVGVRKVVDILRAHPNCTRPKLLELTLRAMPGEVSDDARETVKGSLASDLRWLIAAGHVIEFSGGVLYLVESRPGGPNQHQGNRQRGKSGGEQKARKQTSREPKPAQGGDAAKVDSEDKAPTDAVEMNEPSATAGSAESPVDTTESSDEIRNESAEASEEPNGMLVAEETAEAADSPTESVVTEEPEEVPEFESTESAAVDEAVEQRTN